MKFLPINGSTFHYFLLRDEVTGVRGYVEKIRGKWYAHDQQLKPEDVDLSRAAGPFPTIKAAKAACLVLYS